jgi:hypothetical protein
MICAVYARKSTDQNLPNAIWHNHVSLMGTRRLTAIRGVRSRQCHRHGLSIVWKGPILSAGVGF